MSTAELSELEEIETLIANGRRLGVLTHAELARAVSVFDLDEADIEKLQRLLENQGIELVEELDVAAPADAPAATSRK
jgi:Sigma-70 factor, region 1.1